MGVVMLEAAVTLWSSQCHQTASRAGGFTPKCHIQGAASVVPRSEHREEWGELI